MLPATIKSTLSVPRTDLIAAVVIAAWIVVEEVAPVVAWFCQNVQFARLIPPYVPDVGEVETAAARPVMFLPPLPVPSP